MLRKAEELDPMSPVIQNEIARQLILLGRFDDAENQLKTLIRKNPDFAPGYREMASLMSTIGRFDEQAIWVRKALALDPGNFGLYLQQAFAVLNIGDEDALAEIKNQMAALDARGIRIRSRALITTLFARLVLSDLFIHGIGGAKYDQVTDELARRFFGLQPPKFATMSATLRLPIDLPADRPDEEPELRHEIRELQYHPERFLPPLEELLPQQRPHVERLLVEKRRWIETPKTPTNAGERHRGIVAANAGLKPFVADAPKTLHARHAQVIAQTRASVVLRSREYAFCLHSFESLSGLLLEPMVGIA